MITAKIFLSNKNQTIRLPKTVAFPEEVSEVSIIVVGKSRLISPKDKSWDLWFDAEGVTEDFMSDREQAEV